MREPELERREATCAWLWKRLQTHQAETKWTGVHMPAGLSRCLRRRESELLKVTRPQISPPKILKLFWSHPRMKGSGFINYMVWRKKNAITEPGTVW